MLFNKDEHEKIKKLHDSIVKDFYNKFERETDQEFLKEAISEMKRYERNWSYMKASEKRNIAPGGIKELKQNIAWAEERLKQLKSGAKDSKVKDDSDLYSEFGTIVDDLMNAANDAYKARKKYGEASKQFAFLKAKIQVEKDSEILKKYMDFQKEKKRYDNMAGFM